VDLLGALEPLTHRARAKRVVALARAARDGGKDAADQLATLASSPDAYARMLALMACSLTRDVARIEQFLADPSRLVRRSALRAAAIVLDDERAANALTRIDAPHSRKALVQALWRRGRTAAIGRWLETAVEHDPRAVDLIPLAPPALIAKLFASVRDRLGPDGWMRLAKHAPALSSDVLLDALANGIDARLRWRLMSIATVIAHSSPDRGLALLDRLFELGEEPGSHLCRSLVLTLLPKRPREVFEALKRRHESGRPAHPPGAFGGLHFDSVAHRLTFEQLAYLIEHAWDTLHDDRRGRRWLLALDESTRARMVEHWLTKGRSNWGAMLLRYVAADRPERERAYQRWSNASRGSLDGVIPLERIAALPHDLRAREARRHIEKLEWLQSKHAQRVAYARFLPAGEAQKVIAPYLGHPEGEERAHALRTLIAAVPFERARLPAVLAAVRDRKFEQDPVRQAMMEALAALPAACFKPDNLVDAGQIVKDGLDAADLSYGTAAAIERWVVRLFRVDPAWGAKWLAALLEARGNVSASGLGDNLSPADARRLAPELVALARLWSTRERASAVIWLARSLDRRLSDVPALLDALEHLARDLPFVGVATAAIALITEHDPQRFARLAPELVAMDASFVLIPSIALHISLHRQDLLEPHLSGAPVKGRFATGKTAWIIDFPRGATRWTSRQQSAYASALDVLLLEEKRDTPALRWAMERRVRLAFAPSGPVIALTSDPRQPVREMAVRGLAWLDGPEALDALIECMGDARARWAIYALRRLFAEMSRAETIARLREVPLTKVTVAKEVMRLLGELGGPNAYAHLLAMDREPLHRDVRIALLRALWDHLAHAETWAIFDRAATQADWVVASRLADIPAGRLTPDQEEHLIDLLGTVLGRAEADARTALLAKAAGLPLADRRRRWFRSLVERITTSVNDDEARAAASAALVRMLPSEVDVVAGAMQQLLPRRKRFLALLTLFELGSYAPAHQMQVSVRLLELMATDPLAVADRLRFGGAILGWREMAKLIESVSAGAQLTYDAMQAAESAIHRSVSPEAIELLLARSPDANVRRLAVAALTSAARPKEGWTMERRTRLEAYRQDSALVVRAAAHHVFPTEL